MGFEGRESWFFKGASHGLLWVCVRVFYIGYIML